MKKNTFVTHLECSISGKRYEKDLVHGLSDKGKPLLVRYDLEKIKEQEEKAREELSKQVEAKEEENIAEGKLEIDDPIEKIREEEIQEKQAIDDKENLVEEQPVDKKRENKFKVFRG